MELKLYKDISLSLRYVEFYDDYPTDNVLYRMLRTIVKFSKQIQIDEVLMYIRRMDNDTKNQVYV